MVTWRRRGTTYSASREQMGQQATTSPQDLLAMLTSQVRIGHQRGQLTEIDAVRIGEAVRETTADTAAVEGLLRELTDFGGAAFCHGSGQRDLPMTTGKHNLARGQVRLGRATGDPRNPAQLLGRDFALDLAMLRTSLVAVGGVGSGKTRGLAAPVIEHLCLQSLARRASVVVFDVKGDDFDQPGMFDIDITLGRRGSHTLDLYGGARSIDEAADRLATSLLDLEFSGNRSYYSDAAQNAMRNTLKVFHAAHGRYPAVPELHALLRGTESAVQSVRDKLRNQGRLATHQHLLDSRAVQAARHNDSGASLVERVGQLCRDDVEAMLDPKGRQFSMATINQPTRVRLSFPEARYPGVSRLLTRVALAQFVNTAGADDTNRGIFKGLVLDEAGRYIDDYAVRGVQRLRDRNAGLILLTQSLAEMGPELLDVLIGSIGCIAAYRGLNPNDARYLSDYWGTDWFPEETHSRSTTATTSTSQTGQTNTRSSDGTTGSSYALPGRSTSDARGEGVSSRMVERPIWSPSDLTNATPVGHAVISTARTDGISVPPTLVNLRS